MPDRRKSLEKSHRAPPRTPQSPGTTTQVCFFGRARCPCQAQPAPPAAPLPAAALAPAPHGTGPVPQAQAAAVLVLPRLSLRRAGERDEAAPGTRKGATPRLKVAGALGGSGGWAPQRAALPPEGTALQEETRACGRGRGRYLPRGHPGYLSRRRRRRRPAAAALCPSLAPSHKMADAERRAQPPRAALTGCTSQWADSLCPLPSGWLRSETAASACPFPLAPRGVSGGGFAALPACGRRSRPPGPAGSEQGRSGSGRGR